MEEGKPLETPEVLSVVPTFAPPSQTLLAGSLLAALLLLLAVILFNRRKSSTKGNSLLLVGPLDAGKTTILSSLVYRQILPTHTSLQTNSSVFVNPMNQKVIHVIDVPGHPRIRYQFRDNLADAKAIAFVVDASNVSRNGQAVAEHIHHILHAITSLPPSQTPPSLLILAHKSDLLKTTSSSGAASAHTLAINRVKTVLERELEKRRVSQSGGVGIEGLGEEGERSEMGGLECGENGTGAFKFDEWEGGEVIFLGTSVKTGKATAADDEKSDVEDGLAQLEQWVTDNM